MKNKITLIHFLFFTCLFLFSNTVFTQAPEKLSYQSVIRRTNNDLVVNQNVRVKISILQGTISGTAVYVEDHSTSTNSNGLVSLSIGGGNNISGSFSAINWENGPYFVKMEADPTGGTNYTVSGTSQLLSVPYALYAKTSGSSQDSWKSNGNTGTNPTTNFIGTTDAKDFVLRTNNTEKLRVTSGGNVGIGTNSPQGQVHIKTTSLTRALTLESHFNPLTMKALSDGCYLELYTPGYTNSTSRAGWMGYSSISSTSIGIWNQTSNGKINFATNNSQRMTIDSAGNVGIGLSNPSGKFHVNNDVSGSDSSFIVTTAGKIGIGTTSPTAKLDVSGTVKIADGTQGSGKVLTSDASGNASWQTAAVTTGSFTNMQVYSTSGTSTFTVPAGVTKIMVEVWGGGGGGGIGSTTVGRSGYGGGGGGYGKQIFTVTSGTSYTVTVGAGGLAGTASTSGGSGGTSSFSTLVNASGGTGGWSIPVSPSQFSTGGSSTATFNISGQNAPIQDNNGGNCFGGSGGIGAMNGNTAKPGVSPGGGGGAGSQTSGYTSGAAGGVGRVVIWY